MTIGWAQNTVILEAELTLQEKLWYIRAVRRFGWSKLKLMEGIAASTHLEMALNLTAEVCYTENNTVTERVNDDKHPLHPLWQHMLQPDGRICDERPVRDHLPRCTGWVPEPPLPTAKHGVLTSWNTGFYAMATPTPMGTTPAPAWADDIRKMSDGLPVFEQRAGPFSTRDRMAAPSPETDGKLNRSSKRSAARSRKSPPSCWEPTICSRAPAYPPPSARREWNGF